MDILQFLEVGLAVVAMETVRPRFHRKRSAAGARRTTDGIISA
jgi:hypothetical protein